VTDLAATVADRSERELIARIRQCLPPAPEWLLVGIGDDAAVAEPERNRVEVLTVDALVEGIHFDRAFVSPGAIGHRALAVNLSDLAAMGAAPRLALLSMVLPATLGITEFDGIVGGFTALANRYSLHIVGGNITRSPGPLMLDVTVMGTVKRRQALTRSGARPGDDVYVSGTIGAAAAGLALLRERQTTNDEPRTTNVDHVTRSFLYPEPRLALGVHLSRNRAASACMDLSDGLADGLRQIAEASGVGMIIDTAALPIEPAARAFLAARGLDAVAQSLTGGDDYELLFAVRPRTQRRLSAAMRRGGVQLTRIGRCTAQRGVSLRREDGSAIDLDDLPRGFTHFR
jgi:thiamine-monophosphate kinase